MNNIHYYDILLQICLLYRKNNQLLFWPEKFIKNSNDKFTLDNVLKIFKDMEKDKIVNIITTIRCQEGHSIWAGPEDDLANINDSYCNQCDEFSVIETHINFHVELTKEGIEKINKICLCYNE